MGGQGRKTIIPHVSPKRYRKRCREPKPLPLGEVSPQVTERASPARKSRCAAMGRLFVRAMLSQRLGFAVSILALSVSSQAPRQLPQRGSHWHVGQAPSSYNLSVSLRSTAPLVGEPLAKPFTLRGLPKPPLGRGGGSASALTERLSSSPSGGAGAKRLRGRTRQLSRLRRD